MTYPLVPDAQLHHAQLEHDGFLLDVVALRGNASAMPMRVVLDADSTRRLRALFAQYERSNAAPAADAAQDSDALP